MTKRPLSQNIATLRENLGLTQEELAMKVDAKRGAVAQWEAGNNKPGKYKIAKLAKLAGVTEISFEQSVLPLKYSGNTSKRGVGISPPSANGSGIHITKSEISERPYPHTRTGEGVSMAEILSMTLIELLQLQREGTHDDEVRLLVAKLVYYQEKIKALEEKNQLLKDNLQDLRNKK